MGGIVGLHQEQAQPPGRWENRIGILEVALKCLDGLGDRLLGVDHFPVQRILLLASSSRDAGQPALAEMKAPR